MKSLKTFFFLFVGSLSLFAQDAVFNQFQNSPLQNNPALAGEEANGRLNINYQSGDAYLFKSNNFHLLSVSYDQAVYLENGDQIGVGVRTEGLTAYLNDERILFGGISIAYRKLLNEGKHIFAAAIEGGPRRHSLQPHVPSSTLRSVERAKDDLYDLNVGLSYTGNFEKIKELQFGLAFHHIDYVFIGVGREDRLYTRFTAHSSFLFAPSERSFIQPQVFIRSQALSKRLQDPFVSLAGGAIVTQKFEGKFSEFSLNVGSYLNLEKRNNEQFDFDNLTFVIGFEFKGFVLNYSSYFNLGDLKSANRTYGQNELSFIMKM